MADALIERMRRARERTIDVGGSKFTIRRPTAEDVARMKGWDDYEPLKRFVVGWDLKDQDLLPGGSLDLVAFTEDRWREWVADHPEVWAPIGKAIVDLYEEHQKATGDDEKN